MRVSHTRIGLPRKQHPRPAEGRTPSCSSCLPIQMHDAVSLPRRRTITDYSIIRWDATSSFHRHFYSFDDKQKPDFNDTVGSIDFRSLHVCHLGNMHSSDVRSQSTTAHLLSSQHEGSIGLQAGGMAGACRGHCSRVKIGGAQDHKSHMQQRLGQVEKVAFAGAAAAAAAGSQVAALPKKAMCI